MLQATLKVANGLTWHFPGLRCSGLHISFLHPGFVLYKGGLLDVEKLMGQLKRSEKARTDTEQKMLVLKDELSGLKETATKSANTVKDLSVQLHDYKEKLQATDQTLAEIKVGFLLSRCSETNFEDPHI